MHEPPNSGSSISDLPRVSVITPVLNRAHLLESTLQSVVDQDYPNVEHIVIDGGSTDGTQAILERWGDRIRWVSEPDDGMYAAINKGLAMATGSVMAYLNSDDDYFPWTVSSAVRAFTRFPDADAVYGDTVNVDEDGRIRLRLNPPFIGLHVLYRGFLTQPAVFWRRRMYEAAGGFRLDLRLLADCDYWMRTLPDHKYRRIDEFLAVERDHPETMRALHPDVLWAELELLRDQHGSRGLLRWLRQQQARAAWFAWHRWIYLRLFLMRGSAWQGLFDRYDVSLNRALIGRWMLRGRRRDALEERLVRIRPAIR